MARIVDPQAVDWQRPWRQNVPGFYADENAQHRWEAIQRDEDNERQDIYRRRVSAFARAAAILALLPQSSPWRPIESAPRDGTVILVGHAKAVFDAWWQDGAWVDGSIGGYDDCLLEYEPTHWMPLPPSPQAEGEG